MSRELKLTEIRHPTYRKCIGDWYRWQMVYDGGRAFVNSYLTQYSKREDNQEYLKRKQISYCPRFAGAAIDDVKNSIYQRMTDISRTGGDSTYKDAIQGLQGGVDLDGSSMNRFIGQMVLPELLVKSKVGIYVDMPTLQGDTLYDVQGKHPYLYIYCAEDIPSWNGTYDSGEMRYTSLLLRDTNDRVDEVTGLVRGQEITYRYFRLTNEGVLVRFLNSNDEEIAPTELLPRLRRIPFILAETNKSLMEDIADYQIALLQLESADLAYVLKSNFPFYVEQYDQRAENAFARNDGDDNPDLKRREAVIGTNSARRYPVGAHAPAFIHPSPEPLMASMAKESQLKDDIRKLLNLSLGNIEPKFASAESKGMDQTSLNSGLSAIGLILEHTERQVAEVWSGYMNGSAASVTYPRNYSLKSESERREEAKADKELMAVVPSRTYQREVAKKIVKTMVGHLVSNDTLEKMNDEINKSKYISSDVEAIVKDLDSGLVTEETASEARGYEEGEVEKARTQHAERLARIMKAQTPVNSDPKNPASRGLPDQNPGKGNTNPDNVKT